MCRVYALEGVAEAASLVHCRQRYFGRTGKGVVPLAPVVPMGYSKAYLYPKLA